MMKQEKGKRWKAMTKTITAVLMAFALVIGLLPQVADAAAAAGELKADSKGKITVTDLGKDEEGVYDQAEAYQIVKISYDEANNNVTYEWINGQVQEAVDAVLGTEDGKDATVEDYVESTKENKDALLYAKITDLINRGASGLNMITPTSSTGGTAVFENCEMGWYLIVVKGVNVYAPMLVAVQPTVADTQVDGNTVYELKDQTIKAKGNPPTIVKEIVDGNTLKDDTVAVDADMKFKLTVTVPDFPQNAVNKKFELKDSMEKGLQGVKGLEIVNDVDETLTEGTKNEDGTFSQGADYAVTYYSDSECTQVTTDAAQAKGFLIEFNVDSAKVKGKTLTVTYTAKATAQLVPGTAGTNTVTLIWPKNIWDVDSDDNEKEDKVDVYTYGIDLLKVKEDKITALAGAEFKLYSDENCKNEIKFVKEADGVYRKATAEEITDGTNIADSLAVDKNGKLILKGLDEGTYYLKETKAPAGYTLLTDSIAITITAETDADSNKLTGNVVEDTDPKDAYENLIVINKKGFNLPSTGDVGTIIFSVVGMILMSGALILLVAIRKRRNA